MRADPRGGHWLAGQVEGRRYVDPATDLSIAVHTRGDAPMTSATTLTPKAASEDFGGRFREVISDPLNMLIERVPMAGLVEGNEVILHNGNRVPFEGEGAYYGPFSNLLIVNRGVHEPLEEFVFQELLRSMPETPLMIELGAYWAHYSMWLKKARRNAKVIMVEPDPSALAAGQSNFARNGFDGEFIQAAVTKGQWELDPFLQSRGIDKVDILHVDIQGYETHMIVGAQTALAQNSVDYCFISTHSQAIHQQMIADLTGHGYRIEAASDFDDDTTSFDGLVFASSPRSRPIFHGFSHFGRTKIARSRPEELLGAIENYRKRTLPP
jgi:Methyltransferase FkbM domain